VSDLARPRVLGLVPARGGSKGIPRKNARPLAGRPLLAWTLEHAVDARFLEALVVSTDDDEIASIATAAGVDVLRRPAELSGDTVPTLPVVLHVLDELDPTGARFDAVCLLQPTSPFRPPGFIDRAIRLLAESGADSVISVLPIPHHLHPDWALVATDAGSLRWASGADGPPPRRQDLRPAFHREGSLYLTRTETLRLGSLYGRRIVPLPADPTTTVNIDGPDDWERAEDLALRPGHAGAAPSSER
jgi:CMP-N-acetylneuraminic acid synthetase